MVSSINPTDIFSFKDKILSIMDTSHTIIDQYKCPKGWERFGSSCYYLSNTTSRISQAKKTCNHTYLTDSQLIRIKSIVELIYAAHHLMRNNLVESLIEIDPYSFKEQIMKSKFSKINEKQWKSAIEKIRDFRRIDFKQKKKMESSPITIDRSVDSQIDDSNQLNDIRHVCDEFIWNAINMDSTIFVLTRDFTSNKFICSINNIEEYAKYSYICEYVTHNCSANNTCGNHGYCINYPVTQCLCYFYREGLSCEKYSRGFLQIIIGLVLIGLSVYSSLIIKLLIKCYKRIRNGSDKRVDKKKKNDRRQMRVFVNDLMKSLSCVACSYCRTSDNNEHIMADEQKYIHRLFVILLMLFFIVCGTIPTYFHWNSFNVDKSNSIILTKKINEMINQCGNKSIFNINKSNFYFWVTIFWFVFCFLIWLKTCKCGIRNNFVFLFEFLSELNLGKCLTPIEPFRQRNSVETSVILSLVMIDILISLEQTLFDIKQLWTQGVIYHFVSRAFIPLLKSLRYYPIFLSLQQRDRYVLSLSIIYILSLIGYMIIRGCFCLDFLPDSSIFSLFDQINTYVQFGNLIFLYGLLKNLTQYLFLSYISAELIVRLFYNSYCIEKTSEETVQSMNKSFWNKKISTKFSQIPITTITMCSYTIAFTLLIYLTCMFAFQPMIKTNFTSLIIFLVEYFFDIEIDLFSFDTQIILSSILTTSFFSYQLYRGLMEPVKNLQNPNDNLLELLKSTEESRIHDSLRYLSFVFLNIIGGYYIWFHLIFFVVMLIWPISLPLFTHWLRIFSHLFSFVVPLLVLYGLKHCLPRLWSTFVFPSNQNQNEENNRKSNEKMKSNRNYYGLLVYVTFILSCHITIIETAKRLISALAIMIFEMPRLNSSCFIRRWETSDSSYMAYLSYLHMEKTYRIPTEIRPEPDDIVGDNNENDYSSVRSDTQRAI
ncbi:unnamed protein product [Adineta ricciae]|uniref:EGF-like domain-containing protein n=1 Tax=Adineta ricciae TaxID=249248 RepID=A0A815IL11_ADIRI|nr:unnamed protein product [Adineta ricciae]